VLIFFIVENCALPDYYAASSGSSLPTFPDNLSVPSSGGKSLKMRPTVCPETSVTNYHYTLRNSLEERRSHVLRGGSQKSLFIALGRFDRWRWDQYIQFINQ